MGFMKALHSLLFISALCGVARVWAADATNELAASAKQTSPADVAAAINATPDRDEDFIDTRILRDFIESRNLIQCRQKCGSLTIAGDVRAKWATASEVVRGEAKRGVNTETAINAFKSEFNLFMDYTTDNSWVTTKLRWSVLDGVDGGGPVKTDLDRAFMGYDIFESGAEDLYIEVGRTKLDYLFESRVEFGSLFNGIHLYYTNCDPRVGTLVIHGGPFVVDAFTNHYAWVVETSIKDLIWKGASIKYSMIDWFRFARTFGYGTKNELLTENNPRYRFLVSQMIFGYERTIDVYGCKLLYAYAAVLANHLAKRSPITEFTYSNKAWYVGFTLGKLCKAGDWSLDVNYQSVGAQAIPEFDMTGIGRGNADNAVFYNPPKFIAIDARGYGNFRGFQISALYALTNTLSMRAKAEWTKPLNVRLGGDFTYRAFEFVAIYAF